MKIKRSQLTKIVNEEHISVLKEEKARLTLLTEYDKLLASGMTRDQADVEILNRLDEGIWSGLLQHVKEWLFRKIISALGINTETAFSKTIINAFGQMSVQDWIGVFRGDCELVANIVVKAIHETITETYGTDKLAEMFGYESGGIIADLVTGAAREYIGDMASSVTEPLTEPLTKWICSIKFGGVVDSLRDVTDSAKSAVSET
tara:strand:- start:58 stop:669 length:612 start_codon:yes stop_codon:yes gene_type:complete